MKCQKTLLVAHCKFKKAIYVSIGNTKFILGFYINYMECKLTLSALNNPLSVSFRLTIWNVNEKIGEFLSATLQKF